MKGSLFLLAWLLTALVVSVRPAVAQDNAGRDLVWTCPVHREVTEADAGSCHVCERNLVQTLVQQAWSCPIHAVISESAPGECPICARDLYLMTEEVRYACPMHPEESSHEEGTCSICHMALEPSTSTRPHQDHNPKHGGMFFMAPDNWHHLEGAYPEEGVFRVYLYDNFSQPMSANDFEGRAVLKEVFDADTRETREMLAYPLRPSPDGAFLEARVGSAELPREITAKVRFARDAAFERFDFIFAGLSEDVELSTDALADPDALTIPERTADIVDGIAQRNEHVRELIASGAYNEIYLPALQAKDLAVALEERLEIAPADKQASLQWALKQLVRSAWLLDDYGDLGNREKIDIAYRWFEEAVEGIRGVYP